jgi:glycosyltransferase involved in cell wall biosynthesis
MKVAFVIDTLQVGGAEKSIYEIARRLVKVEPVVITLFSKKPDMLDLFVEHGIKVVEMNLDRNNKLWWQKGKTKLQQILDVEKPEVVHANLFNAELVARLAKTDKFKLVGAFVNDSYSEERYNQQSFTQNLKLNFYRAIDKYTARKSDYFTSVTAAVADTNCKVLNIPREKVHVIFRGRNVGTFSSAHPSYQPGSDTFIFLVVARLLKRKGFFELIEAVSMLSKNGKHKFIVKVAGDGVDEPEIKARANQFGVSELMEFMGNRNDVPDLLRAAHCFVLPSHYEGIAGASLEAMLAAKPVITSDINVFQELVVNDKTGKMFRLMDAADLSQKMLWMMDHYEEGVEMGKTAQAEARKKFDIDNVAQQYDDFYVNIIQKNGR